RKMKKMMFAVVFICLAFFANACTTVNEGDTHNYNNNDAISVTLDPTSPAGDIAPGDNRTLAVFTVSTKKDTSLFGLDLYVIDNYSEPDFWFVDVIWIEDGDGNIVYDPQYIMDGFDFWGESFLPKGESKLVVKGHVTFGEQLEELWDPRPEFQVVVNGIYAENEVNPETGLASNGLIPKYTGTTHVQTSLAYDSLTGTVYEGFTYEVYKFNMWASDGNFIFSNPVFEYNADFDGDLPGCSFWEGNTLLSDSSSKSNEGNYLFFDQNADAQTMLITVRPRTFSLWCQVETNSDNQRLNVRLAGGYFRTGPSGMYTYIIDGPWSQGIDFVKMDELSVNLLDSPFVITPGVHVTLMKFNMQTSANEAKLYSLPFIFRNRTGFSNCHIEDAVSLETLNVGISGYDLGGGDIYEIYFFAPSTGEYPGDDYDFTVVGTTPRTFNLVCSVAPNAGLTTSIEMQDVFVFYSPFDIKPDGTPLITKVVTQP
ncbi:MAG: hypothetical protein NTX82_06275, partial [Candidatus Parcubacteria bacterium]|nr:hypothetical protein [Candidatus Parcubacteria bacterium]